MIKFGIPDDEQVLTAIGKVAIRHGQMDYVLRMTIKSVAGISIRDALDATERTTSGPLRDRVLKLARKRLGDGEALLRLQALLTRSRRATDRRNQLLHGLWAVDEEGRHVLRHDDRTFNPIPAVAELESLADDLSQVASELNAERLDGFLKDALDAAPISTLPTAPRSVLSPA